jgi:hypothetical protein
VRGVSDGGVNILPVEVVMPGWMGCGRGRDGTERAERKSLCGFAESRYDLIMNLSEERDEHAGEC